MKVTRWTSTKLISLAGLVVVWGCAAPSASRQTSGLSAQQLMNVGQPQQKSSWLPKLPFSAPSTPKSKANASETSLADEPRTTDIGSSKRDKKKEPPDMMSLARLNERRGQLDVAKAMYQKELEKNPQNGPVHHRLAVIAAQEGEWDKAHQHFQFAQRIMPNNSDLLSDMGYALYLEHRLDAAEACLRRAVAASSRNQAAHNNLGIVLGVQGKFEESFAEFKRAGSTAEAHNNLAYVYAQLGDVNQAMANLDRALTLDSNLKTAAIAAVQLHDIKQRFDTAPKADKALVRQESEPQQPPANTLAAALERQAEEAREAHLQQAPADAQAEMPPEDADRPAAEDLPPAQQRQPLVERRPASASDLIDSVVEAPPRGTPGLRANGPERRVAEGTHSVAEAPRQVSETSRQAAANLPHSSRRTAAIKINESPSAQASGSHEPMKLHASPPVPPLGTPRDANVRIATDAAGSVKTIESRLAGKPGISEGARDASSVVGAEMRSAQVVPTSANIAGFGAEQYQTLLRRIPKPNPADDAQAATAQSGPAPIVSPSQRMQEIRQIGRQEAEAAKAKELAKPYVKLLPATKPLQPSISLANNWPETIGNASLIEQATAGGGGSSPGNRLPSSESGLPQGAVPVTLQPGSEPHDRNMALPSRHPSVPIPRPEDLMPRDALLQQAPTSQLHPAAQNTWTAYSQPLRYLTDQNGLNSAHFFNRVAPSVPGKVGSQSPPVESLSIQLADQSQMGVPPLPNRY